MICKFKPYLSSKFVLYLKYFCCLLLVVLLLPACSNTQRVTTGSKEFFAMDTFMKLSVTSENPDVVLEKSYEMIKSIEKAISRTDVKSDIYQLNHSQGKPITVEDTTYEILTIALEYARKTNGAFDPTICAITDLWAVGTENARVPSSNEIENALKTVSYHNVLMLENNQVQLLHGAQIDLGAVGKGYAADQVVNIYQEYGVDRGVISLAGNVYLYGEKEGGSPWKIGITNPDNPSNIIMQVETGQTSVVTTGAYERYFEEDGIIYHHIFNGETGYPTQQDLKSVTVVSPYSTYADIYATSLYIMGYEKAINFANQEGIDVILIRNNGDIYVSQEIADNVAMVE